MLWLFLLLSRCGSSNALHRRPILCFLLFSCFILDVAAGHLIDSEQCMGRPRKTGIPSNFRYKAIFGTATKVLGDSQADGDSSTPATDPADNNDDCPTIPAPDPDVPGPSEPPSQRSEPTRRLRKRHRTSAADSKLQMFVLFAGVDRSLIVNASS